MHLLLSLLLVTSVFPRWAENKEAGYAVTKENAWHQLAADGSYTLETEREVEVLKESERLNIGLTRLTFPAHASDYELLEAYTRNGEKISKVRPEHVEMKPLASSGPGFDEQRQVTIAFPDVRVGSFVYYKYRRKVKTSPIAGLFSAQYPIGWGEWQRAMRLQYDSALPLYYEAHDPEQKLAVTSSQKNGRYLLTVELKSPVQRVVMEEEDFNMDARAMPWIAISTAKDWPSFPRETPTAYEKIVEQGELPKKFLDIYQGALAGKNSIDQINLVTSELAAKVRYVGDWVPVKGLFHPRPLAVVAETGFGDCKDFSTVTATILRKLGFETHVAWTNRGNNWSERPLTLPTAVYNHAIVYAKKDGREFWLDPTNTTSFAQGAFDDIAGREALILNPAKLEPRTIPPASASQSNISVEANVQFEKDSTISVKGNLTLAGRSIIGMTSTALSLEKSHIDYLIVSWLTEAGTLLDWKLPPHDFSSRIVKDFYSPYQYRKHWNPVHTSAGTGFLLPAPPYLTQFQFRNAARVAGLYIPDPKTWSRKVRFLGKKALLKEQPACRAQSPWLDFSRVFRWRKRVLELEEKIEVKKSIIPPAEIHSPAFVALQKKVGQCLQASVVVFE